MKKLFLLLLLKAVVTQLQATEGAAYFANVGDNGYVNTEIRLRDPQFYVNALKNITTSAQNIGGSETNAKIILLENIVNKLVPDLPTQPQSIAQTALLLNELLPIVAPKDASTVETVKQIFAQAVKTSLEQARTPQKEAEIRRAVEGFKDSPLGQKVVEVLNTGKAGWIADAPSAQAAGAPAKKKSVTFAEDAPAQSDSRTSEPVVTSAPEKKVSDLIESMNRDPYFVYDIQESMKRIAKAIKEAPEEQRSGLMEQALEQSLGIIKAAVPDTVISSGKGDRFIKDALTTINTLTSYIEEMQDPQVRGALKQLCLETAQNVYDKRPEAFTRDMDELFLQIKGNIRVIEALDPSKSFMDRMRERLNKVIEKIKSFFSSASSDKGKSSTSSNMSTSFQSQALDQRQTGDQQTMQDEQMQASDQPAEIIDKSPLPKDQPANNKPEGQSSVVDPQTQAEGRARAAKVREQVEKERQQREKQKQREAEREQQARDKAYKEGYKKAEREGNLYMFLEH